MMVKICEGGAQAQKVLIYFFEILFGAFPIVDDGREVA